MQSKVTTAGLAALSLALFLAACTQPQVIRQPAPKVQKHVPRALTAPLMKPLCAPVVNADLVACVLDSWRVIDQANVRLTAIGNMFVLEQQ